MRILIADDDTLFRTHLAKVLGMEGHEVVTAVNGREAWQALQAPSTPQVAILDWVMPEMDGLEVVRKVRAEMIEHPPHLILLTSKSGKAEVVSGLEAGADDYVSKPFDTGELLARLEVGRRMVSLRDTLAFEARHDSLTGLLNRGAILEQLRREMARSRRQGDLLVVAMLDVDHFKRINDTRGHMTGDDVLRRLAEVLARNLRAYDAIGRIGGEEFLVITAMKPGTDCLAVFDGLRKRIAETPLETRTGPVSLTVSVGIMPVDLSRSIDEICHAVDGALYRAKQGGRDRVVAGDLAVL